MLLLFSIKNINHHLFGKQLFIWFTVRVFRVSIFVCPSFPFGLLGGMWDVIVLIPDHCLSIYFAMNTVFSNLYLSPIKYIHFCRT